MPICLLIFFSVTELTYCVKLRCGLSFISPFSQNVHMAYIERVQRQTRYDDLRPNYVRGQNIIRF